jgi:hypothetical protein
MLLTAYNKYAHKLYICRACGGKGKRVVGQTVLELECQECLGVGVKVFSLGRQVRDAFTVRSILSSFVQQNQQPELPALKFRPSITQRQVQPPPYNPWRDPNHSLNPNNPNGWTHPFSQNNPAWRNNPANPNSLNNPNNLANPNRRFRK